MAIPDAPSIPDICKKLFEVLRTRLQHIDPTRYRNELQELVEEIDAYRAHFRYENQGGTIAEFEGNDFLEAILQKFRYYFQRFVNLLSRIGVDEEDIANNIYLRTRYLLQG